MNNKITGPIILLSQAWTAYTASWWRLITASFFAVVIPILLQLLFSLLLIFGIFSKVGEKSLTALGSSLIIFGIIFFVSILIIIVATLFVQMSLIITVIDNNVSLFRSYGLARSRFFSYLWLIILSTLVLIGAMFLFFVPGIIWGVSLSFLTFVFFVEGRNGIDAIARSRALVRGRWWAIFGRLIIPSLIWLIIQLAISAVIKILLTVDLPWGNVWLPFLSSAVSVLLIPFMLLYFRGIYLSVASLVAVDPQVKEPYRGWPTIFSIVGLLSMVAMILAGVFLGTFLTKASHLLTKARYSQDNINKELFKFNSQFNSIPLSVPPEILIPVQQ